MTANYSNAQTEARNLSSVNLSDTGLVAATGFQGVIYALLDVADAIREQTAAIDLGGIRDDLGDIAHGTRRAAS